MDVDGAPVSAGAASREERFTDWVRPHLRVLTALAARQVGSADAPDVVQNALVRAWRRWDTYRPDAGTPRAWLAQIVFDQSRRLRIRARPQPSVLIADHPSGSPDERLDVERAVRELPRRQQEVVALFYLADLGVAEVAAVLRISPGSVKSHLSAARAALRVRLGEQ